MQKQPDLEEFYSAGIQFLQTLKADAASVGIDLENLKIDHICYRTRTSEEYQEKKNWFATIGDLLAETPVNGRPISTYQLHKPFIFANQKIDIIEIPAPKPNKPTVSGFEHVEAVVTESFASLKAKYPNIKWDTGGMAKNFNPELEVSLPRGAIKFHHQSLLSVVNLEIQAEAFFKQNQNRVVGIYFVNGLKPQIWVVCLEAMDQENWSREYPEMRFFSASDLSVEQKLYENEKLIRGEEPKEFRLPQQVKVFVFCQTGDGPLFLLLKRSPKANHFWQGITGAPFHGETWEASAIREVFEETEIKLGSVQKLDVQYFLPMDDRWLYLYRPTTFFIFEQACFSELRSPQKPILSDEHEAYKWCTYTEAMSLLKWPNNKKALNILASKLGVTEALTDKV